MGKCDRTAAEYSADELPVHPDALVTIPLDEYLALIRERKIALGMA